MLRIILFQIRILFRTPSFIVDLLVVTLKRLLSLTKVIQMEWLI